MSFVDPDQIALLKQTRDRAAKLVEEIRRQRDELLASPPKLSSPEAIAAGRMAMESAVASAERMLAAVESALADVETNDPE